MKVTEEIERQPSLGRLAAADGQLVGHRLGLGQFDDQHPRPARKRLLQHVGHGSLQALRLEAQVVADKGWNGNDFTDLLGVFPHRRLDRLHD